MTPPAGQAGPGTTIGGRGAAPVLRPYQADALGALCKARAAGLNRLLIKKPTGTGKTVMFAAMLQWPALAGWMAALPPAPGAKMLVIAHREELLDQAADKIRRQNPGLVVDIEQGDRRASAYSDVVIASIQTLAAMKFRRLERLTARHTFRLVIVDEAHHAAAKTYRLALAHLGFLPFAEAAIGSDDVDVADWDDVAEMEKALAGWDAQAPKDRLLVGVTATPNRSDAIGLGCVFQSIAYSYALKDAIADKWLVPIVPWVVETTDSLDDVRTTHGEFNQRDLADAVNNPRRNKLAVAAWQEHAAGLSTIAFTVDVAHAHDLARTFVEHGIRAMPLSGETPKEERRQILRNFTDGLIEVVTNCMVLTEGTDLPRTGCILHAKPTKSATLYEQMTGRGLRIHPGKTECIVIDIVDIARRHSLQAAPVLYGLPPGVNTKGEDLRKLAEDLEALNAKYPGLIDATLEKKRLTLEQLRASASTFDVWTVPELGAFGKGRALDWGKFGPDTYRLQYPWTDANGVEGTEILTVQKDLIGHWDLSCTFRPKDSGQGGPRQRTLSAGLETSDQAAGIAEAYVLKDRRTVTRLVATDARWKGDPATDKQRAILVRNKVQHKPDITKGEATKLIDLVFAKRNARR